MREDGRLIGGKVWMERVCNREEWKTLLRTAGNRRILHMPMECMNMFNTYATSGIWNDEVASRFAVILVDPGIMQDFKIWC